MERGYSVYDIRGLPGNTPHEQIERIVEAGFSSLTNLVIAEANGHAPAAAGNVLGNAENCDAWLCALMHVRANLSHSMARRYLKEGRQAVTEDAQFRRLSASRDQVTRRLTQARRRVALVRDRLDKDLEALLPVERVDAATEGLMRKYEPEYQAALVAAAVEAGATPEVLSPPEGADRDIAWAQRNRLLREPVTEQARVLLEMNDYAFAERVGEDVRNPEGVDSGLRHPLLLDRWGESLRHLAETTAQRLGREGLSAGPVPDELWTDLPDDDTEAQRLIGRLRFLEAVRTRRAEHAALLETAARQIRYEMRRQRAKFEAAARAQLREQHQEEYALYAALTA